MSSIPKPQRNEQFKLNTQTEFPFSEDISYPAGASGIRTLILELNNNRGVVTQETQYYGATSSGDLEIAYNYIITPQLSSGSATVLVEIEIDGVAYEFINSTLISPTTVRITKPFGGRIKGKNIKFYCTLTGTFTTSINGTLKLNGTFLNYKG